jgi:excisionase family DNA binding protein
MREETMTVGQAAIFLQMHENSVRNLLKRGELPGRKVGGEWRVLRSALERYMRQTEPVSEPVAA